MLFEVVIVDTPNKTEIEDGKLETLIDGPRFIIAKNDRAASTQAVLEAKDKIYALGDASGVEVYVRPFA